jgi:Fic family protein
MEFLSKEQFTKKFWNVYKQSEDYKRGMVEGVRNNHPLLVDFERMGLEKIYKRCLLEGSLKGNFKEILKSRSIADWLSEWKKMHDLLFEDLLKTHGKWRQKNVRFGHPGEEDLYRIPHFQEVGQQVNLMAHLVKEVVNTEYRFEKDKYIALAKVHYGFVRVHPFDDGNGRIARAITDQVAMFLDYPVAMAGYPRYSPARRVDYHEAIRDCIYDPECKKLALWIRTYIEARLKTLA